MKYKALIKVIAYIELLIGLTTILSLIIFSVLSLSKKPPNVFIFVLFSSCVSTLIGLGLLNYREWARRLLLFFSTYIVLTKALIFMHLLQFSGEIITFVPFSLKNLISILYHSLAIVLFNLPRIKTHFTAAH